MDNNGYETAFHHNSYCVSCTLVERSSSSKYFILEVDRVQLAKKLRARRDVISRYYTAFTSVGERSTMLPLSSIPELTQQILFVSQAC